MTGVAFRFAAVVPLRTFEEAGMGDAGFTVAPCFALLFGLEPGFVVAPADLDAAFTVAPPPVRFALPFGLATGLAAAPADLDAAFTVAPPPVRFDLLFGLATGFAAAPADLDGRRPLDLTRDVVPLSWATGLLGGVFGGERGLRFFGFVMVRRNTAAKQYLTCRRWETERSDKQEK